MASNVKLLVESSFDAVHCLVLRCPRSSLAPNPCLQTQTQGRNQCSARQATGSTGTRRTGRPLTNGKATATQGGELVQVPGDWGGGRGETAGAGWQVPLGVLGVPVTQGTRGRRVGPWPCSGSHRAQADSGEESEWPCYRLGPHRHSWGTLFLRTPCHAPQNLPVANTPGTRLSAINAWAELRLITAQTVPRTE